MERVYGLLMPPMAEDKYNSIVGVYMFYKKPMKEVKIAENLYKKKNKIGVYVPFSIISQNSLYCTLPSGCL